MLGQRRFEENRLAITDYADYAFIIAGIIE
jgi:hypothetical protein